MKPKSTVADNDLPVLTITHNEVKEPEYDVEALKANIAQCDKHIAMLQQEIDNQKTYKEELARLIKKQEEKNMKKV